MATIQYVVNAVDGASATFARIAGSADNLLHQLDDIGKKSATARVGLAGDKEASLSLDKLDLKMAKFAQRIATGKVGVEGQARAILDIRRLELEMDKLGAKSVTAHVKVDVDRSRLNRLTGGLLGAAGSGGGAGAGTAALGSLASPASGSLGAVLGNPYALGGIGVAAAATAPFAATAAAGSIVTVFGGAMTALGVIAASKTKYIQQQFAALKTSAGIDLAGIRGPFTQALTQILFAAQETLPKIFAPLKTAFKEIGPQLGAFGQTFIRAFASPSVARSIRDMGGAFAALVKAVTPMLPSIINQIADGIDGIAQAIKAHPQIFADMINFLGHLAGWSLAAVGALTRVANWMVQFVRDSGHWLNQVRAAFVDTFSTIRGNAIGLRNSLAATWNTIWANTVTRVQNGIATVIALFRTLPGRAITALTGLGHSLYAFAHAALTEFLDGFKAVAGSVLKWIGGFVSSIVKSVEKLLHIGSPSAVFHDIGMNMMLGLERGIKAGAHRAADAARGAVAGIGAPGALGGPTSAGARAAMEYARSRLSAYGWGPSQMSPLINLWNQESGWNRLARNPSSGAYGIPQALPPGKMGAAANPPLSSAAAQINWGLGYIKTRPGYGSPAAAWAHEQAFNWYDRGGYLPVGASIAVNNTGQPEQVLGPGSLAETNALLRQAIALLRIAPAATSAGTAQALNSAARGALR